MQPSWLMAFKIKEYEMGINMQHAYEKQKGIKRYKNLKYKTCLENLKVERKPI